MNIHGEAYKLLREPAVKKIRGLCSMRTELKGLNVQVVGLGMTGLSVARFLARRGARVTATDLRPVEVIEGATELMDMGVQILGGGQDIKAFGVPDMVVVSPGVASDIPLLIDAREKGSEVISDIELASRFTEEPIIAVTGTNGKTTTTTLIGKILEEAGKSVFLGGNIGVPVIESVAENDGRDFLVLEISSFHLETTSTFKPYVATLLNISDDHLYRYEDFDDYVRTKFKIFMNQTSGDYSLLNMDDPVIENFVLKNEDNLRGTIIALRPKSEMVEGNGLCLKDNEIIFSLNGKLEGYPTEGFDLIGTSDKARNSVENIMGAIATARLAGVDRETIIRSINNFTGLAHRMEFIREFNGVSFINDSKATNVGSLMRALEGLSGPVVLIAGGVDKGGDYKVLRDLIDEKVRLIVLTGEASKKIEDDLGDITEVKLATNFDMAVKVAAEKAGPGETVLLSPACSSFDEFKSFAARGERFREMVQLL